MKHDVFYRQRFIKDVNCMLKDSRYSWNIVGAKYYCLKKIWKWILAIAMESNESEQ